MQFGERTSIFLKIVFPLLILALLGVSPVSYTVESKLRAAAIARESGQHQAAAEALRQVALREPWRVALWEQIGREEYTAGRFDAAADALETAGERGALSQNGRVLLGEVYWQQQNLEAAEDTWKQLIAGGSASELVYERLAHLYRLRGDFSRAVDTLRGWRQAFPGNAKPAFLLGLHLCATEPGDALPRLLDASRMDTNYTAAVQTLRRGLAQFTGAEDPAYAWLSIGRSLGSIGQWDLAQEVFEKAVAAAPHYAEAWALLGEARIQLGGTGKSELEKARSLDPGSVTVNALSALILRRQGDYAGALVYLQEAAKKEPENPAWQMEIGVTLAKIGDLPEAYTYYTRAIDLAPRDTRYRQALVWFSAENYYDPRGVGLPAAHEAILLAPNDAGALDAMGYLMARLGDNASAERFLQQALEHDSNYAPANLHLALIYMQWQDMERARFYLKTASGLDENGEVGQTARRLLRNYFGEGS